MLCMTLYFWEIYILMKKWSVPQNTTLVAGPSHASQVYGLTDVLLSKLLNTLPSSSVKNSHLSVHCSWKGVLSRTDITPGYVSNSLPSQSKVNKDYWTPVDEFQLQVVFACRAQYYCAFGLYKVNGLISSLLVRATACSENRSVRQRTTP